MRVIIFLFPEEPSSETCRFSLLPASMSSFLKTTALPYTLSSIILAFVQQLKTLFHLWLSNIKTWSADHVFICPVILYGSCLFFFQPAGEQIVHTCHYRSNSPGQRITPSDNGNICSRFGYCCKKDLTDHNKRCDGSDHWYRASA